MYVCILNLSQKVQVRKVTHLIFTSTIITDLTYIVSC